MALVFHTTIYWFIIAYFIINIQKKDVFKSIILYMLLVILVISVFTTLSLNLEFINLTNKRIKFLDVVLYRNIIVPFLLLDFIKKFNGLITYKKKIALVILLLIVFEVLEFINIELQLYTYVRWNFLLDTLLKSFYISTALMLNKGLHIIQLRGEMNK